MTRGTKDTVMQVANHHSTLTLFAAVQALLECGAIYDTAADATADRIIKLCKAERQRQLRKMDAARARLANGVDVPQGVECEAGHAPGGKCEFGPYGWRGVIVCKHCKQAPPDGVKGGQGG